jgi:hypothetical protein
MRIGGTDQLSERPAICYGAWHNAPVRDRAVQDA